MSRKLICLCNFVTEREIVKSIEKGAVTLDDIKTTTSAGTSCGRCHPAIENLIITTRMRMGSNQLRIF